MAWVRVLSESIVISADMKILATEGQTITVGNVKCR